LYPEVAGAITGIHFKEGTHVEKGQVLYEIDKRIYQANYDAAVANLKVQQGNLVQAQQDADRYEYLNKYNAVAKQLYDHAIITLLNAKNTVKSAEEAVKSAKTSFTYAVVKAPFSGTIGFSQVKLGNVVSVGTTVLNTISTDNPMAVDFLVNEKNLPFFEKLLHQQHPVTDSLFTLVLPDNSLYSATGKIYIIDRAVDPQTGSITVRLIFPNPQDFLKVGMSCVVRVHNQEKAPQLVVPSKAVVEQMGEYFVFVARDSLMRVDPKSKTDTTRKKQLVAVQKKVMPGQTIGPDVIIKSGINDGDKIVADGVQTLHDGSQITTANKAAPSQGGRGGRG
jgi:membrane fusion protein (multidrug efflux system)